MLTYTSSLDALCDPTLFTLGHGLHMLSFKAMKIVPAHFIIQNALMRGDLKPGGLVVETSSGNFAMGMAVVCNKLNLRFIAIGDPAITPSYKRQMEMLGGRVDIITDKRGSQGYQKARLERLHDILDIEPDSFWCRQYDNEDNALAYRDIGQQLSRLFGRHAVLVAPVGSGGSSCGITSSMREAGTDCQLIGVDTFNSVLFGQGGGPMTLRGLGNTIMPHNLRHNLFDTIHWIKGDLAHYATRELYKNTSHFRGPTTGAAAIVAQFVKRQYDDVPVIFMSPDDGSRYVDSTYIEDPAHPEYEHITPIRIAHPTDYDASTEWAWMPWNRSSLQVYG